MIQIDFDSDTNRLLIQCPFHLNGMVRELPSRKWDDKRKRWTAPLLSANLRELDAMCKLGVELKISEAAAFAINAVRNNLNQKYDDKFPRLYQFTTQPMPHQLAALDAAWPRPGFALFMEMGTGKTKIGIDLACCRYSCAQIDRLLILCPLSVRRNWAMELERHATLDLDIRFLDTSNRGYDKWCDKMDTFRVLIAGIEGLGISSKQNQMLIHFVRMGIDNGCMTIVDESHKIKNHKAIRTDRTLALGEGSGYRMIMTGTAINNGIEDLYTQLQFVDPNIIGVGDYYSFRNRYCIMGGFEDRQVVGYRNMDELTELMRPWVFQVRKRDVLKELPPKTYQQRLVQPSAEQRSLLAQIKKQPIKPDPVTGEIPIKNVLERMLRLQQVTGGFEPVITGTITLKTKMGVEYEKQQVTPRALPVNPKLDELLELLNDVRPDAKVIIWARFVAEIEAIRDALEKRYPGQVAAYFGATPEADRAGIVQRFQTGDLRFLVGNQATGGVGIELYAASLEIFYSNGFSYAERVQSEDRAHRKGQIGNVTIVDLMMEGSVDTIVAEALDRKMNVDEFVRKALESQQQLDI